MNKYQEALDGLVNVKENFIYHEGKMIQIKNIGNAKLLQELVDKVESKTTAKELFEKLGFSIDEQDEEVIAYSDENYRVIFYFINKTYSFYRKEDDVSSWVHVVLHQAITQQLKELGWLE